MFVDPCRSLVLTNVICRFCNSCRDLRPMPRPKHFEERVAVLTLQPAFGQAVDRSSPLAEPAPAAKELPIAGPDLHQVQPGQGLAPCRPLQLRWQVQVLGVSHGFCYECRHPSQHRAVWRLQVPGRLRKLAAVSIVQAIKKWSVSVRVILYRWHLCSADECTGLSAVILVN